MTRDQIQVGLQAATVALLLIVALLLVNLGSKLDAAAGASDQYSNFQTLQSTLDTDLQNVDSNVQKIQSSVSDLQACFMPKGGFNFGPSAGECRP